MQKVAWFDYHFSLLRKSEEADRPVIGIIALEPGLFSVATVTNFKMTVLLQERDALPSKQAHVKVRTASDTNFFKKVLTVAKNYFSDDSIKNIVIAGPGTYKTKFNSFLQEEWRNHNKIFLVEDLSSAYYIQELVNRQTLQKLAGEYQVLEESAILSEFEKRLGQNFEKICYGLDQSIQSVEQGALETILLLDTFLRSENDEEKERIVHLMDLIDKTRVKFFIVDNKSENGKIVQNFGGVVGLLRYSLFFEEN